MPNTNNSHAPRRAPSPFNAPDADIILRSSDNVDFRVHRRVLKQWSPWWASVLDSHNPGPASWMGTSNKVSVVGVDENAQTTFYLLRYLYPQQDAGLPTLRDAFNVLKAARKYTMVAALKDAKKVVAEFTQASPLAAYAAAERLHMPEEMRMAAAASLAHGPLEKINDPILEHMRADPYRRLLLYHRHCAKAAKGPVDNLRWMVEKAAQQDWHPVWATCTNPACPKSNSTAQWFLGYRRAVRDALARSPCTRTLENPALVEGAVRAARPCKVCSRSARRDLEMFNTLLRERIEPAVAYVPLDIGF